MVKWPTLSSTTYVATRDGYRDARPELSLIDSERFGVTVARHMHLTAKQVRVANEFCQEHGIDLLIARCPTAETATIHELERDGFQLMDTLVYWRRALNETTLPSFSANLPVRSLEPSDTQAVATITAEAFRHYAGHYHLDPRLDPRTCTEVYVSWATRCICEPGVADAMFGAERDGQLVGFVALKRLPGPVCDIMLAAVTPTAQGQGVFRTLIAAAVRWMVAQGCQVAEYSCVLTNIVAQKALARAGFQIERSYHTFHKWFPERPDGARS